ncbi:Tannase and feruloyl esterase [Aquimixticola soesokkakensis]|uniref:Tannase and feruloyl esterase n=1 Tax=Aquimixticola soesokkakensis TaxID=1519096 RepID=A0A1Y5RWY9_9RHOB|nr:tannase/feruloyl esterase family alpha/beta hydrolase [Aquimixticola soesokkakensis]SLN26062.1 Tannase and feruloyl esterase [Aquimixticola soesokkakensis]
MISCHLVPLKTLSRGVVTLLIGATLALPAVAQIKGPAELAVVPPVISCAALMDVDMTAIGGEGSAITAAKEGTSGDVAVCAVEGTLAPQINFEVVLPLETWTQRYLQVGCGGLCGSITLRSGASNDCAILNDGGFVMAATDMGHSGGFSDDGSWGENTDQRKDFAYLAQHLTAKAAKLLIANFYGQAQAYAYFNGCSDGGREALMEAMRFPEDFDGVIAGAPAMLFQVQNTLYHGWQADANTDENGQIILLSDRLPILHDAVVAACDPVDGATDGLISDPSACLFDLDTITCAAGASDTSACLTPAEADVARRFYEGPIDATTGAHLTAGQPQYGSELNWAGVYVADSRDGALMSTMAATPVIKYLAFDPARPDATLADFDFSEETLNDLRARHTLYDATNTDLSRFEAAGGKLILWHGLADPHISPANTLALHSGMIAQMGAETVDGFERLYLLPGVGHCGNGEGPSNLDLLTPMMAWVENGTAPQAVMTTSSSTTTSFGAPQFAGSEPTGDAAPKGALKQAASRLPDMTRPVYPYPFTAVWDGSGDVYDAAHWSQGEAAQIVHLRDWPGADFFAPYAFTDE